MVCSSGALSGSDITTDVTVGGSGAKPAVPLAAVDLAPAPIAVMAATSYEYVVPATTDESL